MTYYTCPVPSMTLNSEFSIFLSPNSIDIFLYLNPLDSFKASTH